MNCGHLLNAYDLSAFQWIGVLVCAMMVGMSKSGINGLGMIAIPVMALVFGGKASTGILLPLLVVGDIFGVLYYKKTVVWKHIVRLAPWVVTGIAVAAFAGNRLSDSMFMRTIAGMVLVSAVLMIWQDYRRGSGEIKMGFAPFWGLLAGFSTMIGNAAGPVMFIYLLAARLEKNYFIGTAAWFFLLVNLVKVPFHVFVWDTISDRSLAFNALCLPAVALGALLGFRLTKLFPEKTYRKFIEAMTIVSAVILFL